MSKKLPSAKVRSDEKLDNQILRANLVGLANNVKWDKLIDTMREKDGYIPSYRSKSVICKKLSGWDVEWYYHLPFPMKSVLFLDISTKSSIFRGHLLKDKIVDHLDEIEEIVNSIGFVYEVANAFIRIFGYAPRDYEDFYEN